MKIRLLTITHKSPGWIQEGYGEYAKRMPGSCALELVEITAEKRTNNADINRIREREGHKLLEQVKPGNWLIALDVKGAMWSTEKLATMLNEWLQSGRNVDLVVGGPDGLSANVIQKADAIWSLSPLTFPHLFVRLIIAEQIYRAHSIIQQHPYHRT